MPLEFEQVQRWVESYGPAVVGIGSTLDNTGVPVFYVAGLAAAIATKTTGKLELMWLAAFLGSVVGDVATYAIGRYALTKDKLVGGFLGRNLQLAPALHAGERAMRRWGPLSLVFGRFVPYIGKVLPLLAGSYAMSWAAAVASIVVGSALLTGLYYFIGELAAQVVSRNASAVRYASLAVLGIALAGLFAANAALRRASAAAAAPAPPLAPADEEPIEL